MKRFARLLRRLAAHLDPPPSGPTQDLRIVVKAETSAAQEALARLALEMNSLAQTTAAAKAEQVALAEAVKVTAQRAADAHQAVERVKQAQVEVVRITFDCKAGSR